MFQSHPSEERKRKSEKAFHGEALPVAKVISPVIAPKILVEIGRVKSLDDSWPACGNRKRGPSKLLILGEVKGRRRRPRFPGHRSL